MTYLLDSDWVADYLKRRGPAIELVDPLFPAGLAISIVTHAEVYEGVYYGRDRARYERVYREFLRGVDILGISRHVARRFAIVRGTLNLEIDCLLRSLPGCPTDKNGER
jgi:tRNA(fMet)-specific endonuclease VapC